MKGREPPGILFCHEIPVYYSFRDTPCSPSFSLSHPTPIGCRIVVHSGAAGYGGRQKSLGVERVSLAPESRPLPLQSIISSMPQPEILVPLKFRLFELAGVGALPLALPPRARSR